MRSSLLVYYMNCIANLFSSFCRLEKSAVIFCRCVWISSDSFDATCTCSCIFIFRSSKLHSFSSICFLLSRKCTDFFLDCRDIKFKSDIVMRNEISPEAARLPRSQSALVLVSPPWERCSIAKRRWWRRWISLPRRTAHITRLSFHPAAVCKLIPGFE